MTGNEAGWNWVHNKEKNSEFEVFFFFFFTSLEVLKEKHNTVFSPSQEKQVGTLRPDNGDANENVARK